MKTINKFLLLLGSLAMTAGMTGCEDTRGEHLEDFASMVYFRNGGNQTISLYRVGENSVYKVPVCKGGSDLSYTAEATVAAVEQAQLDIYNMNNGTNYIQIPSSCFKFLTDTKLHFTSEETSKMVEVELATDDISALQEADPDHEYILALQVYSDRQVSADINLLILKPEITIPVISFAEAGLHANNLNPDSPVKTDVTGEIVLGMDNRWPFDCRLGVHDKAWLDAYNAKNGTEYELMPAEVYTLDPTVSFTEGSNTGNFKVTIDRTNMGLFTDYVIPLYIENCTKKEFELGEEVFLVHGIFTPTLEKIALTEAMLSTPYTHEGDGIGIPGLVDGKNDTYWHSLWANMIPGDPIYGVYIDITLDSSLTAVKFRYQTRSTNNAGAPTRICIGASNDGENWKLILDYQQDPPVEANSWGELPIANAKAPYKYYRFGVATSKAGDCRPEVPSYTNLGELELYGI